MKNRMTRNRVKDAWLETPPVENFSAIDGFVSKTHGDWNEQDEVGYTFGIYIEDDYSIFTNRYSYQLSSVNDIMNVVDGVITDLGEFIDGFDFDYYVQDMKRSLNAWLSSIGHKEYTDDQLRAMVQEGYDYFVGEYDKWVNEIKPWQESVRRDITDSRRVKDSQEGFDAAVAAFESVYNDQDSNFKPYGDFYIQKDTDKYGDVNFDFAAPSVSYYLTTGYSTGSDKVDESLDRTFEAWFDETLKDYQKQYPNEDVYDHDNQYNEEAEMEVYQYMDENLGVWYDVDLKSFNYNKQGFEHKGGVQIIFEINCGSVTRGDNGSEVIMDEIFDVNDLEGIKAFAQKIIDYIDGIHFD